MLALQTARLRLRALTADDVDAHFIVELLNDPAWIKHIGDRGVRSVDDARGYIEDRILAAYARYGIGMLLVELRDGGVPIGLCGLIRRDSLPDIDLGFAFLPAFRGAGFAREASEAVLDDARNRLQLARVCAIVSPDNAASIRLLERLGFRYERVIQFPGDDANIHFYLCELSGDTKAGR